MSNGALGTPHDARILGRGWASPAAVETAGEAALSAGPDKVAQSIRLILGCRRNERVLRPDFGAGLEDFLFEPISSTTAALIRHRVETSLVLWEPRIDVQEVRVEVADRARGRLDVRIAYRLRSANTFYNLVYPFFLHEAGAT
ncbi:GPW/gp25 family protein [Agromyces bracchium]|uniref:IraD/Gp25-like domain-containing protein n=1 Tax=Agromyces bracchium TaxID=88376 RepID=A0A6I3MAF3_9MICO|nr:GPW/gp25 family protein [Agromyces bracchium]MTH70304.1 hypothetical protein [Agromyces bracchium]